MEEINEKLQEFNNYIVNKKVAIMADSVEAVIAAMYFDSGLEQAEKFIIERLFA